MSVALVTGAGGSLGRTTAAALAASGHDVVAVDLDGATARGDRRRDRREGVPVRRGDRDQVFALAIQTGPVDVLVNNAGISRPSPLVDAAPADVLAVLNTNLLGTLWCVQAYAPGMEGKGGCIVNISSGAARLNMPFLGIYPASKNAIESLTVQLAVELGPIGVRVNALAPGTILTPGCRHDAERGRPSGAAPHASRRPPRHDGRRRGDCGLPRLRRGRLHHRAGALRRRWAHRRPVRAALKLVLEQPAVPAAPFGRFGVRSVTESSTEPRHP